ncbi:hypothetical protein PoHVEF18_003313 [Penicillium ochrochloron]
MNPVTNHTSKTSSSRTNKRSGSVEPTSSNEPQHKKQKTDSASNPSGPATSTLAQCPFTDAFFAEMAGVIQDTFPINSFAETYHCSTNDVLDALRAVALRLLCTPSTPGLSVSDHAQILIADWRETVAKIAHDITTISDSTPETNASSFSPTPESPESAPLSNTRGSYVFTSPTHQPSSPPSSLDIRNPSSEPAGEEIPSQPTANTTAAAPKKKGKYLENPTSERVEVRRDYSGRLIPVANWIEGYHISKPMEPLQAGQGDGMTDEEFEKRMQVGWFSEFLEEEELDQVACAKPGLRRSRGTK